MRFFVKMNVNFTSTFFSDHRRLVVAETNLNSLLVEPTYCTLHFLHVTK